MCHIAFHCRKVALVLVFHIIDVVQHIVERLVDKFVQARKALVVALVAHQLGSELGRSTCGRLFFGRLRPWFVNIGKQRCINLMFNFLRIGGCSRYGDTCGQNWRGDSNCSGRSFTQFSNEQVLFGAFTVFTLGHEGDNLFCTAHSQQFSAIGCLHLQSGWRNFQPRILKFFDIGGIHKVVLVSRTRLANTVQPHHDLSTHG